ncbi:MAG: glycosyltransferase family 39 protein [Chloroflexi bacterium]|nr:glycosyltransferase family 39 protein [Chloroflexota bacterium]
MRFTKFLNDNKALFSILILAFLIRLIGISSRPIWYDEAFSILFSEKGLRAMIYGTLSKTGAGTADIHPLGYYTVLWGWINLFGRSILAARLLSILINLISIGIIYLIAENLFGKKTALVSAVFASILPFQVHYAQEIRMYALLSLWLLLATYAFLRSRNGSWKWWILFGLSSALAQYTHNLAVVYLIPLALTPFLQRDLKTLKAVFLASLFAIILYLPWLIHLPAQFSKVNTAYWVERPSVAKIFTLFLFYLPHLPLPNQLLLPGLLIATLTIALAIFQTILARKASPSTLKPGLWTAYLAFMPPLLLWTISQFVPIYIERALLPSHAIFCIWLAWAFTQTKLPKIIQAFVFGLVALTAATGIYQHVTYAGFPYGPFPVMNNELKAEYQQGDAIVHSNKLSYLPAFYFDPELPQGYVTDPSGGSTDTLAPATQEVLQIQSFDNIEFATANKSSVWFIIYQYSIDEYTAQGFQTHPQIEYLNAHFTLTSSKTFGDLRLLFYTREQK